MESPYKGSCLCGRIKFEAGAFQPRTGSCHCSMCRKFHGAAFATLAEVKATDFRWLAGETYLQSYTAPNGTVRSFCCHCGSSLTFAPANDTGELVEIALGCFDDDVPIRPDAHIYVDSAANWVVADDDLPRFARGRDSEQLK